MSDRFELFRLSLLPRPERDMFEGEDPTREEYLRTQLLKEIKFTRYGVDFHYVPAPLQAHEDTIIGRVGRSVVIEENRPPSEGFAETVRDAWKASVIVVDPRHHADGQKAAVEADPQVASTTSIMLGLAQAINELNPRAAYAIEPAQIIATSTFWEFAEQNKGDVTSITFEFVVPNMFGGSDSIVDELREFREKEKAHRVKLQLKSEDGLDVDTERTKEAVAYVAKTGGTIRAKAKKNKTYSSTDKVESTTLPDDQDYEDGDNLSTVARFVKRILGRE